MLESFKNPHEDSTTYFTSFVRLEMTVNVQDAELPQLIAFDTQQDLLPVFLANCSYSLEAGHGTVIEYDFDGIERQIEDRFIRGKPRLNSNKVGYS